MADIFSFATSTIIRGATRRDHAPTLEKLLIPAAHQHKNSSPNFSLHRTVITDMWVEVRTTTGRIAIISNYVVLLSPPFPPLTSTPYCIIVLCLMLF